MSYSNADLWCSPFADNMAANIAFGYCGPNVIVWIAAVWNNIVGRQYNAQTRLMDKALFPDGPRLWDTSSPGFRTSLNDILKRETQNDLHLSEDTYYKYGTIHDRLEQYDMPIIIRMWSGNAWHYVTLYKSEKKELRGRPDKIKFYWQDNGTYGSRDGGNPGLYTTEWRDVGENIFSYGAKRVVRAKPHGQPDIDYHFGRNILGFAQGWTHIIGTRNGGILFYNSANGNGATALLDNVGNYSFVGNIQGFAQGWTHIASCNDGSLLFYNSANGNGATALLDNAGNYSFIGNIQGFAQGWTHIIGTRNGGILFYNSANGNGATALLDNVGNYYFDSNIPGFATGWTHIISATGGSLFFYNSVNGNGATAWM